MKKKRVILAVIILAVIGVVVFYSVAKNNSKGPQYTTATVAKANLKQTVEATGSVASNEDIALSFKTSGRVRSVPIKVGQNVNQAATLASISDNDLVAQVDRARASVESAKADLAKLVSGPTAEDIEVELQQLNGAKTSFAQASASYDNLLATQAQKQQQYRDTALQSISDVQLSTSYTLDVVYDGILDPSATASLQTTNNVEWTSARNSYTNSKKKLSDLNTLITQAQISKSDADILLALYALRDVMNGASDTLNYGLLTLSGAIENSSYSKATLDALKASFSARAATTASAKATIQSSVSDLTVNIQQLKKDLDDSHFSLESSQRSVDLAQARYDQLTAKPQPYEIQKQQALVLQAQADLRSTESRIVDSIIQAPVKGTITKVDIKVGETASPNQDVIHMIGDSKLQIDVDIPESDITKIVIGQKVGITLDAFGSDVNFDGTVSFIEPSQRTIQDVVYYRVTVVFNELQDKIKPGMTATVRILTAERTDALAVPLRAVTVNADGSKTVRVLTATNTIETKTVTTGIRADDGSVEILSGLAEGDKVITGESGSK